MTDLAAMPEPEPDLTQAPDATVDCLWMPSPNFTIRRPASDPPRRPGLLILHYTAMKSSARALYWLTIAESQVSCHYMIDETGRIFQNVRESNRAWQAGLSHWQGDNDINSASIGIEIHNPGPDGVNPEFPPAQMEAVRDLCRDICDRNAIPPSRVLAHSDIAPGRKADPGPLFDWEWLAKEGVGLWPKAWSATNDTIDVRLCQQRLADIGYRIEVTGEADPRTGHVVSAFQLRWRRACYDGTLDPETATRLGDVWSMLFAVA